MPHRSWQQRLDDLSDCWWRDAQDGIPPNQRSELSDDQQYHIEAMIDSEREERKTDEEC